VEAGSCNAPTTCSWGEPTYNDSDKSNHPVVCVDWHGAKAYCEWAGGRLPTEAEWEKAARGPDGQKYPWGDELDGSLANFCDTNCPDDWKNEGYNDGYGLTAPVGSYPGGASFYGVHDLGGNVWEWTGSEYKPYPYDAGMGERMSRERLLLYRSVMGRGTASETPSVLPTVTTTALLIATTMWGCVVLEVKGVPDGASGSARTQPREPYPR
jgi:formylglycine-generating enzyme required for sulfatase activity